MSFKKYTDSDFHYSFIQIITGRGSKNNTYKFALARFLLDYSSKFESPSVRYKKIAEYFFRYYWLQECKSKLRQGPKKQTPEIITIIRKEFDKDTYPQTFGDIKKMEPDKISRCVDQITKKCFDDVIHRFHNRSGKEDVFFTYLAKRYGGRSKNAKIDPGGGILLNPDAMRFFKDNFILLYKAVILEWIRFLEVRNFGTPHLVKKIEGWTIGARDQRKFLKHLRPFVDDCFYCHAQLKFDRTTHVDHVIPFDYVGNTEMWNMVLACQKCNCEKSGHLPPAHYITKLLQRNQTYKDRSTQLYNSLAVLHHDTHDISWHYDNARQHGYPTLKIFPKK